jgi:hypothetical protein
MLSEMRMDGVSEERMFKARTLNVIIFLGLCFGFTPAGLAEDAKAVAPAVASKEAVDVPKELFTGKVVLLGEALKRKGITSFEEMHKQAALETPDGELIPIIADWRGRAFFQDKRLRDRKVELVGTRKPGVPYLQVLMVFTFDEKGERMRPRRENQRR